MTERETRRSPIDAMLEFALDDTSSSADEARHNLEEEGIDVEAFLVNLRTQLADLDKKERLAWRDVARTEIAARRSRSSGLYTAWGRPELERELRRRQQAGQLSMAAHRNHREFTDEDLRTLLEDNDALEGP